MKTKIFLTATTIIILSLFLLQNNCLSQWQKINIIQGCDVKAISKDSSGYLYVVTANNNIFRSTNNGEYWENFTNGLNAEIKAIVSTTSSVLIGTFGSGIYRSTNQGLNWIPSNSGISTDFDYSFIIKDNFVFAGVSNGVYRSTNDGVNWIQKNTGFSNLHGIYSFAISGYYLFASTFLGSQGKMYATSNNGDNWDSVNYGLPFFAMESLAGSGNSVFALNMSDNVYRTVNSGQNWYQFTGVPYGCGYANTSVSSFLNFVAVSYYFSLNNCFIYLSTNYGVSFFPAGPGLPQLAVNHCLLTNDGFFALNSTGIYKSTNIGSAWFNSSSGLFNADFSAVLAYDNVVLAGTYGLGVFRSSDYGNNWSLIQNLDSLAYCYNFLKDNSRVYSRVNNSLLYSTNSGTNWLVIPSPPPQLAVNKYYAKNNLIIADFNNDLYRTTNNGIIWLSCENGLPPYYFQMNSVYINDNFALISLWDDMFENKIYKSINSGLNWALVSNSGIPDIEVNMFSLINNTLFAGTVAGVYTSTNEGNNWIPRNNGFSYPPSVKSIISHNGIIYVGTNNGIYRSINNGNNWTFFSDGLTNFNINSISATGNVMYAGGTGALYKRDIPTSIVNLSNSVPDNFLLLQNYPNPFNSVTKIKFDITKSGFITLRVYDITGREVSLSVKGELSEGSYEYTFDGRGLETGVYFYRLTSGSFTETRKMLLIK